MLYALRDRSVAPHVQSLAFLGTPFLIVNRRSVERGAKFFANTLSWLILYPGILPLGMLALIEMALAVTSYNIVRIVAFFASLALTMKTLSIYSSNYRSRLAESLATYLLRLLTTKQESRLSSVSFAVPSQPVFIASIDQDEARIGLGLFHGAGEWPLFLFDKLRAYLLYFWFIFIAAGVPLAGLEKDICSGSRFCNEFIETPVMAASGVLLVLSFLAIVLPMLSVPVSTVVRGHKYAFGWEGFLGNLVVQIRPSKRPSWVLPLGSRIIELSPGRTTGLRHSSFYQDEILIGELVAWLTGNQPCRKTD